MELLQRALDLTEPTGEDDEVPRYKLRAVTLNNIGCWHRKRGQPREALAIEWKPIVAMAGGLSLSLELWLAVVLCVAGSRVCAGRRTTVGRPPTTQGGWV